jgi:hypothetical protein
MELTWNEWVISYDFAHQIALAQDLQHGSHTWGDALRAEIDRLRRNSVSLIKKWQFRHEQLGFLTPVGLLGLLVLLRYGVIGRIARRVRLALQLRSKSPVAQTQFASVLYGELMRLLGRYGFRRGETQTPLEFASTINEPALGPVLHEFTLIYAQARFGGAVCDATRLRALLVQIRGALRAR